MIVMPFRAVDIAGIEALEGHRWLSPEHAMQLEGTRAFTFWHEDKPVLCGGAVEMWDGRFMVWAMLSKNAKKCLRKLQATAKQFLAGLDANRIEAPVRCDFKAGRRWVESLGFELEVERMRKFLPNGADAALYVRIR